MSIKVAGKCICVTLICICLAFLDNMEALIGIRVTFIHIADTLLSIRYIWVFAGGELILFQFQIYFPLYLIYITFGT